MYTNTLTLSNGIKVPQLGLGTWFIDDNKVADAVKAAVKLGIVILILLRHTEMSVVSPKESEIVVSHEMSFLLFQKFQ